MKPGDWVGGKYRLGLELSRSEDWIRFAVEEPAQPQLELVLPMQHALLRPNVRESFLGFKVPEHPAILPTLDEGVQAGIPWRVRPRSRGPLSRRLSVSEAISLGAALAPAALAMGERLGGRIPVDQITWTLDGQAVMAPTGILPSPGAFQNLPAAEGESEALAVLLYTVVEGRPPRAGEYRPSGAGTEELGLLLTDLCNGSRDARREALVNLGKRTTAPVEPAVLAPRPAPRSVHSLFPVPNPAWFVVVQPGELDDAARARVARESGVEPDALRALGSSWAVEGVEDRGQAERAVTRLASRNIPAEALAAEPRSAWQKALASLVLAVLTLGSAPYALNLLMMGSGWDRDIVPVGMLILTVAAAAASGWSAIEAVRALGRNRRRDEAKRAWAQRPRLQVRNEGGAIYARLARLRDELPALGLPYPAVLDLRQMLSEAVEAPEEPGADRAAAMRDLELLVRRIEEGVREKDLDTIARLEREYQQSRSIKRLPQKA